MNDKNCKHVYLEYTYVSNHDLPEDKKDGFGYSNVNFPLQCINCKKVFYDNIEPIFQKFLDLLINDIGHWVGAVFMFKFLAYVNEEIDFKDFAASGLEPKTHSGPAIQSTAVTEQIAQQIKEKFGSCENE